ncbi:Retrotransposon gag protein [Abeliophyllum distichum]|uniref:Retrotransposon gag protein n=1 Tax=Abeliophyllum distichum TaxID=126358 RepID=A0ABD1Q8X8_9LAMI
MEIPPTTDPPLVLVSWALPSATHINSLASSPNPYWGQLSWIPTSTLVETPVLQRLEDMIGRKIAEAMSKKDFEQPKLEKYDGSSDPVDYLRAFVNLMRLQATPDAIRCRAFLPTLRQEAKDWVATFPPKLIRTFYKNFAAYFISSKHVKKTAFGLMQLTQDKDEMLKDFITQLNRATLGIKDLQMSALVTAMMSVTRSRPFKMLLSKNPPDTMHELLRRGDKLVDTEEAYLISKYMKD